MNRLNEFGQLVEARMALTRTEPQWQADEANRIMAELMPRWQQFEELAPRLLAEVVRPRVEKLASYFPNAKLLKDNSDSNCASWFGYCERFPVSANLEFSIGHDDRIENVLVRFELKIMPEFQKYDAHDKFSFPLNSVDDNLLSDWVEAKLLRFLDDYLRLDRGHELFNDEVAVDPVCGMRITRASAAAQADYRGHPYFFCRAECKEKFVEQPGRFISCHGA